MLTDLNMRAIGLLTKSMEGVLRYGQTDWFMKVNIKSEKNLELKI